MKEIPSIISESDLYFWIINELEKYNRKDALICLCNILNSLVKQDKKWPIVQILINCLNLVNFKLQPEDEFNTIGINSKQLNSPEDLTIDFLEQLKRNNKSPLTLKQEFKKRLKEEFLYCL